MERFIGDLGEFPGFESGDEAHGEKHQKEGEHEDAGHPTEASALASGERNARAALVKEDREEPTGNCEAEDAQHGESGGLRERDKKQHGQSGDEEADADGAGVSEANFAYLFREDGNLRTGRFSFNVL